jgi:putative aldouronate transport system substrate-binding protein
VKKGILVFMLVALLASLAFATVSTAEEATITYWMELHANFALLVKNMGDTDFAKEWQKQTGVKVKFLHPPAGQAREAFNLMIASGDLPDIIEYNWYNVPGGPAGMIDNKVITKLNPVFAKYAPNLTAYLKAHPSNDRLIKLDDGSYYVFPFFRGDATSGKLLVTSGPMVRSDWLADLNMTVPTTLDEWYKVLVAFKNVKKAKFPLSTEWGSLSNFAASGVDNFGGFYVDGGKVKFGTTEPNRQKFFTVMNKWYKEGLLDNNFATLARKNVDANILGNASGATFGSGGSGIGRYLDTMGKTNPNFSITGAPYPTPKKGTKPRFGNASPAFGNNNGSAAISTKCQNVAAAAKFLDYSYGKAGHLLNNFGIAGVSYTMVNKIPTYTALIMSNPKYPNTTIMSMYMRAHTNGPLVQDPQYLDQYYAYHQQKVGQANWMKSNVLNYALPPVTPSPAEASELAKILNDINTYVDEMSLKFIMGVEPLSGFDAYVAQVKKLGIDRALAIYQAAYDRFQKRP